MVFLVGAEIHTFFKNPYTVAVAALCHLRRQKRTVEQVEGRIALFDLAYAEGRQKSHVTAARAYKRGDVVVQRAD